MNIGTIFILYTKIGFSKTEIGCSLNLMNCFLMPINTPTILRSKFLRFVKYPWLGFGLN
jgi:hypothetical protein